jgi:uncharacterized protein YbjQ (UPF0145 family)
MRIFGLSIGEAPGELERKERQAVDIAAIEAGGLPLHATERLSAIGNSASHLFTSDLSVAELLLTQQCGFRPVGQVMGTCVYHVGYQFQPGGWQGDGELAVLTQANYDARHRAMNRLRQEAELLKADGVVGVRLHRKSPLDANIIEFQAIGTAIRATEGSPRSEPPFLSLLSGQDHFTLLKSGYAPLDVAMGNCSWYETSSWQTRQAVQGGIFGGGWQNQELTDFTQAVYTARELAMTRMTGECRQAHGDGLVGVTVEPEIRVVEAGGDKNPRKDLIVSFMALGTVVRHVGPPDTRENDFVLNLR